MHICKFSYLKGSIRVALSWWQLKGLLFFCVSQRLMNIPMPLSYETHIQVEIALKTLHTSCHTHTLTIVSATCIELTFHQKKITCDSDYRLVKVALLWYVTEFSLFLPCSLFLFLLDLIKEPHQGTNKKHRFLLHIKTLIAAACIALKASLFSSLYSDFFLFNFTVKTFLFDNNLSNFC